MLNLTAAYITMIFLRCYIVYIFKDHMLYIYAYIHNIETPKHPRKDRTGSIQGVAIHGSIRLKKNNPTVFWDKKQCGAVAKVMIHEP